HPIAPRVAAAQAIAGSQTSIPSPTGRTKLKIGRKSSRNVISDQVPKRSLRTPGPMPDSNMRSASAPRADSCRGLTLNRGFVRQQVVHRLPPPDQLHPSLADQDGGRTGDAVVVRRHRERVPAGYRYGQYIVAPRLGKLDRIDQDVARLAVLPRDPIRAHGGLVGPIREQRFVTRAVQLWSRIVRHASVDGRVRDAAGLLDDADLVERHPGLPDERASGLQD